MSLPSQWRLDRPQSRDLDRVVAYITFAMPSQCSHRGSPSIGTAREFAPRPGAALVMPVMAGFAALHWLPMRQPGGANRACRGMPAPGERHHVRIILTPCVSLRRATNASHPPRHSSHTGSAVKRRSKAAGNLRAKAKAGAQRRRRLRPFPRRRSRSLPPQALGVQVTSWPCLTFQAERGAGIMSALIEHAKPSRRSRVRLTRDCKIRERSQRANLF